MDIKSLKDKILQLAIQGKLVPQDENDEPASILLEKIKAEKDQLIKDKVIKKEKPLPEISEEEIYMDIPKSWIWTKMGDISKKIHYGYTASAEENDTGVRLLRITDIQNNKVNWNTVPYCTIEESKLDSCKLENNDILIARTGGTIGKSFIVKNVECTAVFASYLIRIKILDNINEDYIKLFLESTLYWRQLQEKSKGTGQANVNAVSLSNLIIPLPPLEEQKRIVAKVDELFELIDELDNNKQELLESISNTRNKVLQLAIQGKLVEQCEDDEPASVLLERIKAEKEQLIKDKIIKKEKPLPEISDEEKVFDLPNGWQWCRLGEVGYFQKGFAFKSKDYTDKGIKITKVSNLNNPNSKDIVYIDSANETLYEQYKLYNDDIVLTTVGSWPTAPASVVGNAIYIDDNFNNTLLNQNAVRIRTNLNQKYINIVFNSKLFKNYITDIAQGTANQASITQNGIKSFTLPVPPLEEQKRIADKVDVIMDYLDKLQQEIELQQIILENILK
mgnify:CR=1 FL=1|jgi:restriction modification system DNA specificity domain protein